MAGLKLNPSIAKELSNGQIQCLICDTQVKPKIWTAHVNGKKHKDSSERLKQKLLAATKRAGTSEGGPPVKKSKEDEPPAAQSVSSSQNGDLPSDFFDNADKQEELNIQTPWQKSRQELTEAAKDMKGAIEGLPAGFFDDKKRDDRVRETMEKNAKLEEEYNNLMRAVNEQQTEEDIQADEEAEREARERDIANIDEQMKELKRLNELEIRKEQLAHRRKKKQLKDDSDDDEDEISEVDFDNWRTKNVF